jgi:GNAT superfamily N-acetyltransferase
LVVIRFWTYWKRDFLGVRAEADAGAWPDSKLLHVIECSLVWRIEINIRTAALSDAGLIAQYNARLALETEQRQLDTGRVLAGVTALLTHPTKGTYYVAECARDGRKTIAGQLLITYEWSDWRNGDFWWIQSVYVEKEFRSHGVFRALFHHVHDLAKTREDVCGLRLYMDAENETARRAYERLGLACTDYQVFEMDFVL